jgi:gas vesicle protein
MRRLSHKQNRKASAGTLVAGILVGGVVGATVGWLTAPATGAETRRRLRGDVMSARDRAKTAAGNVENRVRELVEQDKGETPGETSITRRKRTAEP